MKIVLFRLSVLILCIVTTVAGAIFLEVLLDYTGLEPIKHTLGTAGSILILISIIYSLRKRKIIFSSGRIRHWLIAHEWLAIVGAALIFVHGGFHGHAIVPLLTSGIMFVTIASGLTGRYLYLHVSEELRLKRKELEKRGLTKDEIEEKISSFITAHNIMKHWRTVHIPMVFALSMTVLFHVLSALYYEGI